MKRFLVSCVLLATAAAAAAQTRPGDPRERNFKFFADGALIGGVVGYRIDFARIPISVTDQRRLGIAYAPDQRRLVITVTQKGLSQIQDWLNGATDTAVPTAKLVTIEARNNSDELLARWELTAVMPSTFSSAAAGTIDEVDSTVEFVFDRLRLTAANPR
jgi:polyisoprenoid-binding protein YceI